MHNDNKNGLGLINAIMKNKQESNLHVFVTNVVKAKRWENL